MPNTIGFQISIGNLPEGWNGDPQALIDAVAELLEIKFEEDIAIFKAGSTEPDTATNSAWLRDGTAWFVPDGNGGWRPADVNPDYKRIYVRGTDPFVGADAANIEPRSLWVRTQQISETNVLARELLVYVGNEWRSLYHAEDLEKVTNRLNSITDPDDVGAGLLPNAVSLANIQESTRELLRKDFLNSAHPIGSIYENAVNPANPTSLFNWPESQWVKFGEGRVTIGEGEGAGLTPRSAGVELGTEQVSLSVAQLPAHSHVIRHDTTSFRHTGGSIVGKLVGTGSANQGSESAWSFSENAGDGLAHNNMQPSVVVHRWRRTA